MRRNGTATGSPKGVPVTTRRSDTEFRREISQSDIHADAMRRLQRNPAVRQEEANMTPERSTPTVREKLAAEIAAAPSPLTKLFAEFVRAVVQGDRNEPTRQRVNDALLAVEADNARLRDALAGILDNEHGCTCDGPCDGQCWHAIGRATLAATKPHA